MEPRFNGHLSTADTHGIWAILKVQSVLTFTSILKQSLNSGHPATLYNGWFSRSQLYATIHNNPDLVDTRQPFQQGCTSLLLELTT